MTAEKSEFDQSIARLCRSLGWDDPSIERIITLAQQDKRLEAEELLSRKSDELRAECEAKKAEHESDMKNFRENFRLGPETMQ